MTEGTFIIDHEEIVGDDYEEIGSTEKESEDEENKSLEDSNSGEHNANDLKFNEEPRKLNKLILAKLEATKKEISVIEAKDPDPELIERWLIWTQKGIGKARGELLSQFPRKGQRLNLEAPTLNPEVKSCLGEASLSRDKYLVTAQNTVGSVLMALGVTLSSEMPAGEPDETMFNNLMDAS